MRKHKIVISHYRPLKYKVWSPNKNGWWESLISRSGRHFASIKSSSWLKKNIIRKKYPTCITFDIHIIHYIHPLISINNSFIRSWSQLPPSISPILIKCINSSRPSSSFKTIGRKSLDIIKKISAPSACPILNICFNNPIKMSIHPWDLNYLRRNCLMSQSSLYLWKGEKTRC